MTQVHRTTHRAPRRGGTSRRALSTFVAVALLGSLSSCATPSQQATVAPKRFVEAPTISAKAKAKYGDEAGRAYKEIADFVLDQSERSELLDPARTTFTSEELTAGLTGHMTPAAAATYEGLVARALAGDPASEDAVQALRFYKLQAPGLTLPKDGTALDSQTITGATVGLVAAKAGSIDRLKISFDHVTRINLLNGKSPFPGTIENHLDFTVLPAALVPTPKTSSSRSSVNAAPSATKAANTEIPTMPGSTRTTAGATPTVPSSAYTRDPSAAWLISQFDGDVDVSFDRGPSPAPTG